jgi:hypothetical protein
MEEDGQDRLTANFLSPVPPLSLPPLPPQASASGKNSNTYKNNIMNGCDTAVVKIMIANGGSDPYKHEEFGDTIVVERRLDRQGAGAYHLCNVSLSWVPSRPRPLRQTGAQRRRAGMHGLPACAGVLHRLVNR